MQALRISDADKQFAKQEIRDRVKDDLSGCTLLGARILVGIYQRPEKTSSGIYITDRAKDEDIWQGKVGLILAMGPHAFVEDETHKWPGTLPKVGDWVLARGSDTWQLMVGKQHCRMIEDVDVRMVVPQPDVWY